MTSLSEWSSQFQRVSAIPLPGETPERLMARCRKIGATFFEDGPDDECFVVTLRPDVGPEVWTPRALGESMK